MPLKLKRWFPGMMASAILLISMLGCGGSGAGSSPGPKGNLTVTITGATPLWVAFQNGPGAWTAQPAALGTQTFNVSDPAGRYGIACGYVHAFSFHFAIYQGTLAERSTYQVNLDNSPYPPPPLVNISGQLSNIDYDSAWTYFRDGGNIHNENLYSIFCSPGSGDLWGVIHNTTEMTGAWIVRDLKVIADSSGPNIDGLLATPVDHATYAVVRPNPQGELYVWTDWRTKAGTTNLFDYVNEWYSPIPESGTIAVPPGSLMNSGDLLDLVAYEQTSPDGAFLRRYTINYFDKASSQSMVLPSTMTGTMVKTNNGILAQWNDIPGTNLYVLSYEFNGPAISGFSYITPGWIDKGSLHDYVFPNIESIAGTQWAFSSAQSVTWRTYAEGMSYAANSDGSWPPLKSGDWEWITYVGNQAPLYAPVRRGNTPGNGSSPLAGRSSVPIFHN